MEEKPVDRGMHQPGGSQRCGPACGYGRICVVEHEHGLDPIDGVSQSDEREVVIERERAVRLRA